MQQSQLSIETLPSHLKPNNVFYPGTMHKFGTDYLGNRYIVKIAESAQDRLRLYAERLGCQLCKQLYIETSDVQLFFYNGSLTLLSRNWLNKEDEQFFTLASYYESLIDSYEGGVLFSYDIFKFIVMKKCPDSYSQILRVFWRVFIIDFLLCDTRHAGNLGFIDNGSVRLSPIYDFGTRLESIFDESWRDLEFPYVRMYFSDKHKSAYQVLNQFDDLHKNRALKDVRAKLKIDLLNSCSPEDEHLMNCMKFRFEQLFYK